jgi:nucleotide-binding universal stress UspA family protein
LAVKQPLKNLLRVAFAVDDSRPSRAAARFLRSRILPESATVTILTSVESPVTDFAARYLSESQLAELVIGSRDLTKSERLYLGSVSESLLRHAPCSVLIVRGARA